MNHDPFKRPTAKELLKSEYIPLSQIEESKVYDILDMTISNTDGRTYKHMLHKIFMQPVHTVTDFLYDANLHKVRVVSCFNSWLMLIVLLQWMLTVTDLIAWSTDRLSWLISQVFSHYSDSEGWSNKLTFWTGMRFFLRMLTVAWDLRSWKFLGYLTFFLKMCP